MNRVLPALFLLISAFSLSFAQDGKPNMVIDKEIYDAGTVVRTGSPIDHAFLIKNTGTGELRILEVKPNCGCTVTKFDKVIPPGSEGKVHASVDIGHSKGPIQKYIDIKTNDPNRPEVKVAIKATIKTLVDFQPNEHVRFSVNKGALKTEEIYLIADPSVKLLPPVVTSEMISARLTPDKNGRQKLTVDLKKSEIIGTHATEIKIPVEGPMKEVVVPVVITIQGPLQVSPKHVSFLLKKDPQQSELPGPQEVSIQSASGKSFQVLEVHSSLPSIKVEKKAAGPSPNVYQLSISLISPDRNKKGNTRGEILVRTDIADQPEVKIPVFVNVM